MQQIAAIRPAPHLAKLIYLAAALYLVSPMDLIADSRPAGLFDDAIIVPILVIVPLMLWPRQILAMVNFAVRTLMLALLTSVNATAATAKSVDVRINGNRQKQSTLDRSELLASGAGIMPTTQPDLSPGPGVNLTAPTTINAPYNLDVVPGETLKGTSGPLSTLRGPIEAEIRPRQWNTDARLLEPTPIPGVTPLLKSVVSESNKTLGIVDALDEALLKSPRAAALRANLGIARSNFAYATVQRNPYFFFDRGIVAEAVRRIGPTFTWTPPWQTAFDLLVAKRQVDQAKLEILRDLWALRADVRRAYTDAVIAQEVAKGTENLIALAEKTLQVTQKKFQAGAAPEFDVLKARLAREQAEMDLKQAHQRVIKTRQHLNLLLGRMPKQALQIPSLESADKVGEHDPKRNYFLPELNEEVADLDVFIEQAKKSRWDLTVIGQQIKVNKANLQNAYATIIPIPQLIIGQSVSGNQPAGPKLNATFFTVNAELPFTNLQQGDIAKFKATGKQLGWQMESTKNQVYTEISSAYNDLLTYRDRIRLYQEHVLADSEETARLARRSYEVGFTDITGVIQSQQSNFQIQLQYFSDVQSYQQAFIDLEQAVGRPLQ